MRRALQGNPRKQGEQRVFPQGHKGTAGCSHVDAGGSPFCATGCWVVGHVLNSVEEFHERIGKLVLGPSDRLITADVKDFFVVGEHQYLAKMAASILNAKDRHLVDGVILFLLRSQVVQKHNN